MHRKASTTNTSEDNNNKNKQHHHQHHHHHHQHRHLVQHSDTSNTNDTLREGKLIRLELLSGGLGVDNEDIVDIDNQLEEAAAPLLQQKKKMVGKTDEKTVSSNLAGSQDKDVALIDCVAHAQANVTIRESCDCVYQQQHQPHHSHGSHLHQNPRYNIDPDQLIPAVELGGDIGFRKVANNCAKLAATSKHTAAAAAVTSKAADATVIATKDAAVKAAASKAAAIAAIKAAASTTTGLIDDSTAKVDWL